MPKIIVETKFGFNEPDRPHPDWYDPSDEPVDVSEACAKVAISEKWAKAVGEEHPAPTGSPTGEGKKPASSAPAKASPKSKPRKSKAGVKS